MTIILFILIFGIVVVSHEFGHFLLAKLNGIHVVEFSVGMGPTLWSFTKGDTKYSFKLLPIGGACSFEGEDGLEAKEGEVSEGSFLHANVWARISSVLAGPVFNFILGYIIAVIMVNMIVVVEPVATIVAEDGAAIEAGLQDGDRIISLNGEKVHLYEEISFFMQVSDGQDIVVRYERDGEIGEVTVAPKYNESTGTYLMGISNSGDYKELKGLECFKYAWYEIRYSVKTTFKSLSMLVRGQVSSEDVAGPVGIAVNVVGRVYNETKDYGWQNVLVNMMNITILLSINLGIINLLPIPALDGGRLVFLILEVIRGKPVPPDKEGMVHFIGLMFFMVLMVFLLFNDLVNIFR